MKKFILTPCAVICLLVLGLPVQGQKIAVGTKTFEALARSSFAKEGGNPAQFKRFYKQISASMAGRQINRSELTKLTRIYLNTGASVRRAYELATSEHQQLENLLRTPSPQTPFISIQNLHTFSGAVWRRGRLGPAEKLERFERAMRISFYKSPDTKLTLQELQYLAAQYALEGESAIKRFFSQRPEGRALTRVQINLAGKRPLDAYVYPNEVQKLVDMYTAGVPFTVQNGRVHAQPGTH